MALYFIQRALTKLQLIEDYSIETWGEKVADKYLGDIMRTIQNIDCDAPVRKNRSFPFGIARAREHFILYEIADGDIYIVDVLAQVQDIESRIEESLESIRRDIDALRKRIENQ
jgi:plasmid stabilization system protein ParE